MSIELIAPTVQKLHEYFDTNSTKPLSWRVSQLQALKNMLTENEASIMAALKADLNKGEYESWSSEIGYTLGDVNYALKHIKKWIKSRSVTTPLAAQPGKSYVKAEPLGTVLIIGAWNYPIQLVLGPLVGAIAAGNCAVLKPSELSAHCSQVLAELVPKYLDSSAIAVIEGAVDETTELLKQRFDHIIYTGGETVARIVMRAAAEHLTPITLELGGKSPCVVDSNVDIDQAASRIVWSKWMNAGQTCVAPDYVLVEEKFADTLLAAIKAKINEFYGDQPRQNQDYGRIVNERHASRLAALLENENVVIGGDVDVAERYIEPTVVMQPSSDGALMKDEIFGPILPIITVANINDSIAIINKRSKPLALYVYSNDTALQDRVLSSTSAGNVCVNDGMMFMGQTIICRLAAWVIAGWVITTVSLVLTHSAT